MITIVHSANGVSMKNATINTAEQARAMLNRKGISIAAFARLHGLPPRLVAGVLEGRYQCRIGKSHIAAVLLGMKEGEVACQPKQS